MAQVPTFFISSLVSDGQGHRLCLTDEGKGELVELQVCEEKRTGQKWWLRPADETESRWFIGSALDQGYVLAVPTKVDVGNYFSLKWVDFTKNWQNWRSEYNAAERPENPTIFWQWGPDFVMEPVSNSAGSHLVVAKRSKSSDPSQGFLVTPLPP